MFYIPEEVKVETESAKGKNPIVRLSSNDKQLIGEVAAKIRAFRKPEPYKGKGIKFVGEQLRIVDKGVSTPGVSGTDEEDEDGDVPLEGEGHHQIPRGNCQM